MRVFVRPSGEPLGQTLGFGPNGSSASLDTAPVESALVAGDLVLMQRQGALVKILATAFGGDAGAGASDASADTVTVATGQPARSLGARAADYLNVLDYGADPTGLADSAPAFNAAIASVGTGLACRIRVPRGSYHIGSVVGTQSRLVAIEMDDGADFAAGSQGYFGVTRVDGSRGAFSVEQIGGGFFGMSPGTAAFTSIKTTNISNNFGIHTSVFDERYQNTNRWAATGGTQDQHRQRIVAALTLFDGSQWLQWDVLNGPMYSELEASTLFYGGSSQAGEADVVANTPETGWTDVDGLGASAAGWALDASGGNAPFMGGHIRYAFGSAGGVTGGAGNASLNNRWISYPALFSNINPAPTGAVGFMSITATDGAGTVHGPTTITVGGAGALADWAAAINAAAIPGVAAAVNIWGQTVSRLVIYSTVVNNLGSITLAGAGWSALGYNVGTYFTSRQSQYVTVFGATGITGAAGATITLNGNSIVVGGAGKTADAAAAINSAGLLGITAGVTVRGALVIEAWAGGQQLASPYWSGQVFPSLTVGGSGAATLGLPVGTFYPPSPPAAFATAWSETNPVTIPAGCVISVNGTNVAVSGSASAVAAAINAASISNVQGFVRSGNRLGIRQFAGGTLTLQDVSGRALDLLGIAGGGVAATFQPGGYSAGSFNTFFAAPDAVAPGGRAFYAGGSSSPDPSVHPFAPLEARGAHQHGIRVDRATLDDGVALRMAAAHLIAAGAPGVETFLSLLGGLLTVNGVSPVQAWLDGLPTSQPANPFSYWWNNGVLNRTGGTQQQLTDGSSNLLTDGFGNILAQG